MNTNMAGFRWFSLCPCASDESNRRIGLNIASLKCYNKFCMISDFLIPGSIACMD